MTDQEKQGALGEEKLVFLAGRDGEKLTATSKQENMAGTDFINESGHRIDAKTYGYLLTLQYNKEKGWCSIPHPFNIDSTSTHIYTIFGDSFKRYDKNEYFAKFFKEGVNIDSLRRLAKNYVGRCTEEEYLKRKQILQTILSNYIKDEFRFDDNSKNKKWQKLKVIR